ncbi:MAG: 50S ribosomal protein L11 [archaeon]
MKIKLIVDGGNMKPGPAVAQQLGPMGVNLGKVIEDVNKATEGFQGVKVPVELDVNPKTKEYSIEVFSPPVSEMIKKELGLEKASGASGSEWAGNVAFETVVKIAKSKLTGLLAKDLKSAVKTVIGSCTSVGVLIDSKSPIEVGQDVTEGKYDKEINEEITEVSPEKKKELDAYFVNIKAEQDKKQRAKEAEKAAEEAKKTEEATAKPVEGEKKEEPKKEVKKKK